MTLQQIIRLWSTVITHSDNVWFANGRSVDEGPVAYLQASAWIVPVDANSIGKYRLAYQPSTACRPGPYLPMISHLNIGVNGLLLAVKVSDEFLLPMRTHMW